MIKTAIYWLGITFMLMSIFEHIRGDTLEGTYLGVWALLNFILYAIAILDKENF